ncbi:uncharacterized protein LOC111055702 [Nilaparvata lugens]|uniref:uncharacterized protein LOC111055702 n=1 Tax=Nilaparvata lugens TaxID=108931 RepID=UPI000B99253B|nr:uncharacterized protein LOC111055702 [Nilaparvata lugens]
MLIQMHDILLMFVLLKFVVNCDNSWKGSSPNVGTVIFNKKDLNGAKCWSREEISVLYARSRVQTLLPNRMIGSVEDTIEYLVMCFETSQSLISSKSTYMFIIDALSDTFGGYMQVYGLPLTKKLFYEGNISVGTAMDAFQFQEDIKESLNTDGRGWVEPIKIKDDVCPAKAFDLQCRSEVGYCDQIYMNDRTCSDGNDTECQRISNIPMPMVDARLDPQVVAFPIKNMTMCSLSGPSSNGAVMGYYVMSMCCIKEISSRTELGCRNETETWNKSFKGWLERTFIGHLDDQVLYPAFGGVLQIVRRVNMDICFGETVSQGGQTSTNENAEKETNRLYRRFIRPLLIMLLIVGLCYLLLRACFCCLPCACPTYDSDDPESRPLKGALSATAFCCSESASTEEIENDPYKTCDICGLRQRSDPQIYGKRDGAYRHS